jgi:actin-like ATPase involved in cell morphogenesis
MMRKRKKPSRRSTARISLAAPSWSMKRVRSVKVAAEEAVVVAVDMVEEAVAAGVAATAVVAGAAEVVAAVAEADTAVAVVVVAGAIGRPSLHNF